MNWLLWRQHRNGAVVFLAITLAFAIALWITGVHMAHLYDSARQSCTVGSGGACDRYLGSLFNGYGAIIDIVHLTLVLPVVLGAFLGATLVARETEPHTNVLVWTQGVTRRRWLLTKVAFALVATLIASGLTSVLVTWWSGTPNSLNGDRFQGAQFDTQNIVPVAHALFAVALGIAAGAVLRRVLPAIATTVGVFIAARIVVAVYLRPRYAAAHVLSTPFDGPVGGAQLAPGSWRISENVVDPSGHVANGPLRVPDSCVAGSRAGADSCLERLGFHQVVKFHPASSYWRFQWTESLLFVGLAAVLTAVAVLVTLRRDA
jgi:hypothetical protein